MCPAVLSFACAAADMPMYAKQVERAALCFRTAAEHSAAADQMGHYEELQRELAEKQADITRLGRDVWQLQEQLKTMDELRSQLLERGMQVQDSADPVHGAAMHVFKGVVRCHAKVWRVTQQHKVEGHVDPRPEGALPLEIEDVD